MKNQILILAIPFFITVLSAQQKGAKPLSAHSSSLIASSTYAVVIGISDYQDPGIPDLQFADRDAQAFAGYLRSKAGGSLDADHLKVLINEQATMAQLANVLDWLMESAKEGDQAIIYFSGHGDVEKKTFSQPGFLLCWDAPARVYMAGGAFALPMLQEVISTLSIQNKVKVLMITDACRSGKLAGSGVGGAQITGANLAKQYANEIKILSCQPDEFSIEGTQWGGGRGAFSYHLIDAMYGMADHNDDQLVTLQEISRYLEDHVSKEVAPVSQVPMVIGNRNERMTYVDAPLLASIRSGKSNQMVLMGAFDSRGLESEVLATVDTSIRELYDLFYKALKNKILLGSTSVCADAYYRKLIAEPALEKLHSSMKRNYAAALQDDAQQAINIWLAANFKKMQCIGVSLRLEPIALQLERAAQLLGEGHYMFNALKGRQYLFEGIVLGVNNWGGCDSIKGQRCIDLFKRAMEYEPNSPLVHSNLMGIYGLCIKNMDSAQIYLENAHRLAPSWVLPFHDFYWMVSNSSVPEIEKLSKTILDRAIAIDSTSHMVLNAMGDWLSKQKRYEEALTMYHRYIASGGESYACWYLALTSILINMNKPMVAKTFIEKLIALDPGSESAPLLLVHFYLATRDLKAMKATLDKYILIHPANVEFHYLLGKLLDMEGRHEEAIPHFEFVIQKTPMNLTWYFAVAEILLGEALLKLGRKKEGEIWLQKTIKACINPNIPFELNYMGRCYLSLGMMDEFYNLINKVTKDNPNNMGIEYQVGCLYSLAGKETEALHWLELSIIHNPIKTYNPLEMDFDWDNIRDGEGFKELMKKYYPDRFKN